MGTGSEGRMSQENVSSLTKNNLNILPTDKQRLNANRLQTLSEYRKNDITETIHDFFRYTFHYRKLQAKP
jgi:hypothetical protein